MRVAAVSTASRSICRLMSGSTCLIFSISGLKANFSEKLIRRLATSSDLAATSSGAMGAAGGGTAEFCSAAEVFANNPPAPAVSKKKIAKPTACSLFAIPCDVSPIFICYKCLKCRNPDLALYFYDSHGHMGWPEFMILI